MINNNNNNSNTKKANTIFNTGLTSTKDNRYCIHCHIKLVNHNNEKYVYKCPQCGVISNIHNTEPKEKLVTTFPTTEATRGGSTIKKFIHQADKERLSRSQYYIKQR